MEVQKQNERISRISSAQNSSGVVDPAQLVRIEAHALLALADRLEGNATSPKSMARAFARAVDLIVACGTAGGRVVVTGMGKSGIIAQKIAATLSSTGSPALFLHPAEAHHGDLGMLARGDVVIALSASGETEEILRLLEMLKRVGDALICFCCDMHSTLARPAMWLSTVLWNRRPAHWDWRQPPRPRPCSRSATHWPSPSPSQGFSRRRFCQSASRRKAGQTADASGATDALWRCRATGCPEDGDDTT